MGLRIAALVKQIPAFQEMALGSDGRLVRESVDREMSAFCRRAVSKAVELAGQVRGGSVTVITLGPLAAEDVLREAIAWGLAQEVAISGLLLTDPAFAGSDTIATANVIAAALSKEGPFDLILTGKNSLDADTGQVPPQLAQLLDVAFVAGVKTLALDGTTLTVGCELDDGWMDAEVSLPAVVSCAERLCEPAKVGQDGRDAVPAHLIRTVTAPDLGPGPWGQGASLTVVADTRRITVQRDHALSADAPLVEQVSKAVQVLLDRGALLPGRREDAPMLPSTGGTGPVVCVIAEPHRDTLTRELCGAAARLASILSGSTVLLAPHDVGTHEAGVWGADRLVRIEGAETAEDVAVAAAAWARTSAPWAVIVGSTSFGREVASRVAVAVGAGLTGDAVDLEVMDGRLVAWKPAFAGLVVCAITATTPVQMATVRAGVFPVPVPRSRSASLTTVIAEPRQRVRIRHSRQDDLLERLGDAEVVIGIGAGVAPDELHHLSELRQLLSAEIACTRKVTDKGWMPHSCQLGITGRSISPRLFVSIGASGKFNHMIGTRSAGTVLAVNQDPRAPVWEYADAGIVGPWRDCLPMLVEELQRVGHGDESQGPMRRSLS